MRRWWLGSLVLVGAGVPLACGNDEHPPVGATLTTGGTGMGGNGAGTGASNGDGDGDGDGAGGSNVGGEGGSPPHMTTCGDFFLELAEECEEGNFRGATCADYGFDGGDLSCNDKCRIVTSECTGTESCFDGKDNDGDGLVDCLDSDDCSDVCDDACESPASNFDNMFVHSTTAGHGNKFDSSCSDPGGSGAEVVYEMVAGEDGKLDVTLFTEENLTLSVTTECGKPLTEVACSGPKRMSIDALEGETFYVTIDGFTTSDSGNFTVEVGSRVPTCADGHRDDDEECDDHNVNDGDGCDEDCLLESGELDPNGSVGTAQAYGDEQIVAQISPALDQDVYSVTLTEASSTIVANTFQMGDGACIHNLMDTVIEILDTDGNGNSVLESDDNSGDGLCASAVASGLPAGTYYVRVKAAAGADPSTFPYIFDLSVGVCGNNNQTTGEECDDGNLMNGDGCDDNCEVEF